MITPSRRLPLTRLSAVQNPRTRIFAAGADPKFGPSTSSRRLHLLPAFPADGIKQNPRSQLWRSDVLDRLEPPVTRRHE